MKGILKIHLRAVFGYHKVFSVRVRHNIAHPGAAGRPAGRDINH
jgi:hypothetical protein